MALLRLRTPEDEKTMIDIIARLMGVDPLSTSNNIRLAGLKLAGVRGRNGQTLAQAVKDDDMRRIKVTAQIANGYVRPDMPSAEVHPKLCANGIFPQDFELPRLMKEFLLMDMPTLDRILRSYSLQASDPQSYATNNPFVSLYGNLNGFPNVVREAKLHALFQFLGVDLDRRSGTRAQAVVVTPAANSANNAAGLAAAGNAGANNNLLYRAMAGAGRTANAQRRNASPNGHGRQGGVGGRRGPRGILGNHGGT